MNESKAVAAKVASRAGRAPRGRIKQAHKELTRARLVEASMVCFSENGYTKTTVDDIAESAGVTRATFYLHFGSKADLLPATMEKVQAHFESMYRDLAVVALAPTVEKAAHWIESAIKEWPAILDLMQPLYQGAALEPAIAEKLQKFHSTPFEDLANSLLAAGASKDKRSADVHAAVLLGPLVHYFRAAVEGRQIVVEDVAEPLARAWLAALKS